MKHTGRIIHIYTHEFSNSTVGFDAIIISSFHLALFYTDIIITMEVKQKKETECTKLIFWVRHYT